MNSPIFSRRTFLSNRLHGFVRGRKPDLLIGSATDPYLRRWALTPKDKYPFNIYLHHMRKDDSDRALHDHPEWFISIILVGGYIEVRPRNPDLWIRMRAFCLTLKEKYGMQPRPQSRFMQLYRRELKQLRYTEHRPGSFLFRRWPSIHRLELRRPENLGGESWMLVITGDWRPDRARPWGFYCPKGWRDSREYAKTESGVSIASPGCD